MINIDIDDIFVYADDIMALCEDRKTLEKGISLIEEWSSENDLKINKKKSAILEFLRRRERKHSLLWVIN